MPAGYPDSGNWDFAAVFNLINAGQKDHGVYAAESPPPSLTHSDSSDRSIDLPEQPQSQPSLGNFDKIWRFLGTPAPSLSLREPVFSTKERDRHDKEPKAVTWSDNPDIFPLDEENHFDHTLAPGLTKTQRKRERRRIRKLTDKAEPGSGDESAIINIASTYKQSLKHAHPASEGEIDRDAKLAVKRSKERQSIIQQLVADTPTKKSKKGAAANPHDFFDRQTSATSSSHRYNLRSSKAPVEHIALPGSTLDAAIDNDTFNKKRELLNLLRLRFASDLQTLAGLSYTYNTPYDLSNAPDHTGIHVFVDISNILIGFHDAVKIRKGLSKTARIPRQKLSFHNLSLILERGRPAAKRCLAGSDMLECIEEARQIGYQTSILERVTKEKLLTPRQRYWKVRDNKSGASSGGEGLSEDDLRTVTKRYEQAVDEVIHLNMMLSIVDTAEPSTIVLATGDAAEAEYSQGFLAMCERALSKGWKVEVVAFKHNISYAYRRKDWVDQWNGRFTVTELDEYVELLRL